MYIYKNIEQSTQYEWYGGAQISFSQVDSGALFYMAPSGTDIQNYPSESTWNSIKNQFYSGYRIYYPYQVINGFFPEHMCRIIYLPYFHKGDEIMKNSINFTDHYYTTSLRDDGSGNLYNSSYPGMVVGNFFYEAGVGVLWATEDDKYKYFCSHSHNYDFYVQTRNKIITNEYICKIGRNEFNFSQNPTSINNAGNRYLGLGQYTNFLKFYLAHSGSLWERSKIKDLSGNVDPSGALYKTAPSGNHSTDTLIDYGIYFDNATKNTAYSASPHFIDFHSGSQGYIFFSDLRPTLTTKTFDVFQIVDGNNIVSFGLTSSGVFTGSYLRLKNETGEFAVSCSITHSHVKQIYGLLEKHDNGHVYANITTVSSSNAYVSMSASSIVTNCWPSFSINAYPKFYAGASNLLPGYRGTVAQTKLFNYPLQFAPTQGEFTRAFQEENVTGSSILRISYDSYQYKYDPMPVYVSELGLYNDRGDLIANVKPGRPIRNDPDIDLVFRVSLDIFS